MCLLINILDFGNKVRWMQLYPMRNLLPLNFWKLLGDVDKYGQLWLQVCRLSSPSWSTLDSLSCIYSDYFRARCGSQALWMQSTEFVWWKTLCSDLKSLGMCTRRFLPGLTSGFLEDVTLKLILCQVLLSKYPESCTIFPPPLPPSCSKRLSYFIPLLPSFPTVHSQICSQRDPIVFVIIEHISYYIFIPSIPWAHSYTTYVSNSAGFTGNSP